VIESPADPIGRAIADTLRDVLPLVAAELADSGGPRAYSVTQVADRLGVSEPTVRRLIRSGRLATVPHLSPPRVSGATLADFLAGVA
jgi:hypothetical protein